MKKMIWIILTVLLIFMVAGCSSETVGNNNVSDNKTVCNHTYTPATCLERPRCTKCGYESGSIGSHSYEDGVCTYCNADDPDYEPPVLTGDEYERINSLMQGTFQGRLSTGNRIEYCFENGSFACYTELGSTILENYGTYTLTEKTLILHYQNGTEKSCPWKINDSGEIELFLLDLE